MTIKEIYKKPSGFKNKSIELKAWVSHNRGNKKIKFMSLNDGSCFDNLQVVLKADTNDLELVDKARIGSSVLVKGKIVLTPEGKQPFELVATHFEILALAQEDYPLQKQGMSKEFLREIPHLRHRTNLIRTTMRIRSTLMLEIHKYFDERNYLLVSAPIITGVDGEGAGESFALKEVNKKEFFNKEATLGVTGQLHAESYAIGFGKVYSFNPIFRAESSHTQKHAAEFWMLEPEVAFHTQKDSIELADDLCKSVIRNTIAKHPAEFEFLKKHVKEDVLDRLNDYLKKDIQIIEYQDAIKELKKHNSKFENKIDGWIDLATEHERYLAEEIFKGPVAVINYPQDVKAFYMYQNEDGKTVAAFDILVPGIGELAGGSQREHRYEKLQERVKELKMDVSQLQWYLDLRRFGDAGSAGFGLGFERLVMYVTGIDNIRDVLPFPRTPGSLNM